MTYAEIVFLAATVGDVVTTRIILSKPGFREGNLLVPNHPIWGPVVVGGFSLLAWAGFRLAGGSHPSIAYWGFLIGAAVHGFATVSNAIRLAKG